MLKVPDPFLCYVSQHQKLPDREFCILVRMTNILLFLEQLFFEGFELRNH